MKYIFLLCCLGLSGCTTMQWGEFDGQRTRMADPDVYDVVVLAADGMANFDGRTRKRLEPGFHLLVVASAKGDKNGEVSSVSLPLTVKPCTRYNFIAKHHLRASIYEWDLISTGEKLMPGCEKPASK